MKTFKELREGISEGVYPTWLRVTVGLISLRIRNLQKQIETETDPTVQNKLISHQNTLIGYMSGLGIGIGTKDRNLINRMKSISKR